MLELCRIFCGLEVVSAFVWLVQAADLVQGVKERVEYSRGGLAQMGLKFREGHLDRVQVREVLGQEEHPCASRPDSGFGPCALVDAEVVKDDDVAGRQRRRQLDLDIVVEGGAVHGVVDHPRRGQPLVAQARDQGLRPLLSIRGAGLEPSSAAGTTAQAGHLCIEAGLVDEHQPARLEAHMGLARDYQGFCVGAG